MMMRTLGKVILNIAIPPCMVTYGYSTSASLSKHLSSSLLQYMLFTVLQIYCISVYVYIHYCQPAETSNCAYILDTVDTLSNVNQQ